MNTRSLTRNFLTLAIAALALLALSVQAQVTLPSPTSPNFDNNGGAGDNQWITTTNWDTDAVPTNTADAKINDGLSATYDASGGNGALPFGTLTIGDTSTFTYKTDSGGNADFTDGNDIYFDNNATMIVNGFMNSAVDLKVVGTGAILDHNGQSRYKGTLAGAGSLEIQLNNWFAPRWDAGSFTGDLTFTTSTNTYLREIGNFTSTPFLGAGTNTIGNNIWVQHNHDNMVPTTATVTLVGAAGGNNVKWSNAADKGRETITNLVFDSPVAAATKAYMYFHNDLMKVTDTVTFTGTAGTVWIDSRYADPTGWPGGIDARGADVTFGGTGTWNITGDSRFWVDGSSTITTDVDATIANGVYSAAGFTKAGTGTLTLNDTSNLSGTVTISAGSLETGGSSSGSVALNGGASETFTHSGTGTVTVTEGTSFTGTLAADGGGTLDIAGEDFSGVAAINISGGSTLEAAGATATVNLDGGSLSIGDGSLATMTGGVVVGAGGGTLLVDVSGSGSSDQVAGTLDASGGVLTLDINALGPVSNGDTYTIFTGALTGGSLSNIAITGDFSQYWEVSEGSLILTSTIPEPASILLAGLGLLGVTFRRRRSA